jgi:hypothetical protein
MADGKGFLRPAGPPQITTLFGEPFGVSPAPGGVQYYSGPDTDPGMMAPSTSDVQIDVNALLKALQQRELGNQQRELGK